MRWLKSFTQVFVEMSKLASKPSISNLLQIRDLLKTKSIMGVVYKRAKVLCLIIVEPPIISNLLQIKIMLVVNIIMDFVWKWAKVWGLIVPEQSDISN
jgi:hypothetical protein